MCWKNFISEKVTVFVAGVLFCLLILSSGLLDLHNAAANETGGEIKVGESKDAASSFNDIRSFSRSIKQG